MAKLYGTPRRRQTVLAIAAVLIAIIKRKRADGLWSFGSHRNDAICRDLGVATLTTQHRQTTQGEQAEGCRLGHGDIVVGLAVGPDLSTEPEGRIVVEVDQVTFDGGFEVAGAGAGDEADVHTVDRVGVSVGAGAGQRRGCGRPDAGDRAIQRERPPRRAGAEVVLDDDVVQIAVRAEPTTDRRVACTGVEVGVDERAGLAGPRDALGGDLGRVGVVGDIDVVVVERKVTSRADVSARRVRTVDEGVTGDAVCAVPLVGTERAVNRRSRRSGRNRRENNTDGDENVF
jgi:hypothetical protein